MSKQLLVPVKLTNNSIMHDTNYARGARDRTEAQRINDAMDAEKGHHRWGAEYVMEYVAPFRASLRVVGYYKYHSAAYVELENRQGVRYPMFLGDLVEFLADADMNNGYADEALFETVKKGTSYGIRKVS